MYLDIFSARLKDLMELEGTSIRALSLKIGADRKSIRHWLQGKHFPRYDALVKTAIFFEVSVDYLVGLEDSLPCAPYRLTDEAAITKIRENFLANVSSYMRGRKMTRYAVAKGLQIDPKPVTNWLTKGSMPEIGTLIKLSQLMNCTLDSLLSQD